MWGWAIALLLLSWATYTLWEKGHRWESAEHWILTWTGGNGARGPLWYIGTILSDLGHGFFLASLLWVLWIHGLKVSRVQEGVLWLLIAGLVCALIKQVVDRDRPFGAGPYSWPSGHSAAVLSLALFMGTWVRKPWAIAFLSLGFLVGISRIVHLRHFPSDVLGGFSLAFFVGPLVRRVPLLLPSSLEGQKPRVVGLGIGLMVFLLGVQRLPSRPDLSVGFLGILLFLGLVGLLKEREA